MAERSNRGELSTMSMCSLLDVLPFVSMCVSFVSIWCVFLRVHVRVLRVYVRLFGVFSFVSMCVFASKCVLSGVF